MSRRLTNAVLLGACLAAGLGIVLSADRVQADDPTPPKPASPVQSKPAQSDTAQSKTAQSKPAQSGKTGGKQEEEPDFARRIKEVVNPHFEGEQFGEGSITQTTEDRYNSNFQVSTFDDEFSNDNVGGILLRSFPEKPVKVLHLKSATFQLEDGLVENLRFRLTTDTDQLEFHVPATIVPAAALMAADKRLVLLTLACGSTSGARSHVDLAAIHPAVANHQLGYMAAQLDLSLGNVMTGHGRNYLLCEKAWHLSLKSFQAREDLFTVRCRIDRVETTPPGITESFWRHLGDDQRRYFRVLNNFVTVRRLVRAVIGRYIVGFPENDFIALLKKLQPIYEKQKLTKEQADEMRLMLTKF